jgi:hypothetical protein
MNADQEELSRYRAALASHPVADGGGDCPRPEVVWEAAQGGLPPRRVAELVDHTLACADCALAWQLAVELGRSPGQPAVVRRASAVPWGRRVWGGVLAAAAAVLLAVTIPWQDLGHHPASGYRGGGDEIVPLNPPNEPLPRQNCVLRWESPWPEATYSISVLDERYRLVAEAPDLTNSEYRVPEKSLIAVRPGSELTWHVKAFAPDGTVLNGRSFTASVK